MSGIDGAETVRWLTCEKCHRLHATAGISEGSLCACGARLYPQVWKRGKA